MNKSFITILSLLVFLSSCLKDESFKKEYAGWEPAAINDDWTISTPEEEKIDRSNLEQAFRLLYQDDRYWMARSMLVIRNGKLVAEAYPHDPGDRDKFANIQSCTKTITSITLGIAIKNGVDISVNDKLYDIYPDLFDGDIIKREMTLYDVLTMQAGLEFNNDKHTLQLYQTKKNSAGFVLSFPRLHEPGTVMHYNDGAPQLVSKAIETKTGMIEAEYARKNLFEPLNITDWQWESAHDGSTYGAFSLYLKPRDLAKIGQLLVQNGKWSDKQIIDPDYLSKATSHLVNSENNSPYGLYFWVDKRNQGFFLDGHGGQILLIVPVKNLVILYTAWPYTSGDYFDNCFEMLNMIADGCR
jgi:CubicO group peptidase (beta-lactamase class C family)